MQAARYAIRQLRSFPPPPATPGWFPAGSRRVSSHASAAAVILEKQEVTDRVVDLLRSCPFIDPSKDLEDWICEDRSRRVLSPHLPFSTRYPLRLYNMFKSFNIAYKGSYLALDGYLPYYLYLKSGEMQVSPTANFKNDLQLDVLDNVQVMVAIEEEFAVEILDGEADKISSAAHLIDYIAAHPHAK